MAWIPRLPTLCFFTMLEPVDGCEPVALLGGVQLLRLVLVLIGWVLDLSTLVTCCQMWLNIKIMYLLQLLGYSFISDLVSFHTYTLLLYVAHIWCWILCYIPNHNMLWHSRLRGWLICRHLIWSLRLVLGVLCLLRVHFAALVWTVVYLRLLRPKPS